MAHKLRFNKNLCGKGLYFISFLFIFGCCWPAPCVWKPQLQRAHGKIHAVLRVTPEHDLFLLLSPWDSLLSRD